MPKDERLYGRFTLDFPDSPKIAPLSDAAFRALVEMTLYSRRMLTDGFISERLALARWGLDVCSDLLENDPTKPSLIRVENGFQIHDFAEHQSTKAEIDRLTEVRRAAGQRGGKASARAKAKQKPSKFNPETETETLDTYVSRESARARPTPIPDSWQPNDVHRAKLGNLPPGIDLTAEADAFRNHAIANDRRLVNWDAGFHSWLGRAKPRTTPGVGAASTKAQGWLDLANNLPIDQRAIS